MPSPNVIGATAALRAQKAAAKKQDAEEGWAVYRSTAAATAAKSERLRAARLARDASAPAAPAGNPKRKR